MNEEPGAVPLATVHMFWHGPPLSRLERLVVVSFLRHGHAVDLHVYDEPAGVPAGARLCDAAQILPRDALFLHRRTGSVALFADWFRYRLLAARERALSRRLTVRNALRPLRCLTAASAGQKR